jgi:hypothetical protein
MIIKTSLSEQTREKVLLLEEQGLGVDLSTFDDFWNECKGVPIEFEADEHLILDQDYEELEEKIKEELLWQTCLT